MMGDRLLHRRLREWANGNPDPMLKKCLHAHLAGSDLCKAHPSCTRCERAQAAALADEIERQYVPVPRFPDGEPVHLGCPVCGGVVGGFSVWDDGSFALYSEDGDVLQEGEPGDFAKRPELKALDAEGVEVKVGDTVWFFDKVAGGPVGDPMEVDKAVCGTLMFEGGVVMPAYMMTHREPDSLEKLRASIKAVSTVACGASKGEVKEWADRLTALMERGA